MPPKQENVSEEDIPPISLDEQVQDFQNQKEPPKSLADRMREKASAKWGKLSTYGKITTVAIVVFALLFIVALLSEKTAATIIAVLQIALAVVAVLMHRGIIKIEQKKVWLKWLLLGIAALLTVLNVMSYSWEAENKNKPTSNQTSDTSIAAVPVAAPYGAAECLEQDYTTIQAAFYAAGFTNIEAEKVEDLQATDVDKVNTIDAISVGGKTDFTKEQEFQSDDEVLIRYHGYAKCNVKIHVDFVPNLIFSKYDVNLLLNGIEEGTLTHGEDQDFEFSIDPGEYTLTFESAESSSVKGEVTLTVDCDIEASYKIACSSDKVSVETLYVDRLTELADGEVKLDVAASEYKHKNYEDVAAALKMLGFTNIKYEVLYDIVLGWTDDGEVESVSIADKTDFNRGDVFPADAEIVITYHMPEDDDPNKTTETIPAEDDNRPVFYSTNDYETAKQGNSGVFSYKSTGGSYDIYWIIDFDEGYVYWFTDGNGDSTCDRLKIDSGTLNDKVIITYHDGSDEWSYSLHFKYVDHPETLIMVDNDGFDYKYATTDLNNAISIRDTKTINDY